MLTLWRNLIFVYWRAPCHKDIKRLQGSLPSWVASLTNIRLGWKSQKITKTLAYHLWESKVLSKSFLISKIWVYFETPSISFFLGQSSFPGLIRPTEKANIRFWLIRPAKDKRSSLFSPIVTDGGKKFFFFKLWAQNLLSLTNLQKVQRLQHKGKSTQDTVLFH